MTETFLKIASSNRLVEKRIKIPTSKGVGSDILGFRYVEDINQAAWSASQTAHSQRGVPCIEFTLQQLDEYHLGFLMGFFETACAVSSLLLEVNPFNQPGVDVYKKEMVEALSVTAS